MPKRDRTIEFKERYDPERSKTKDSTVFPTTFIISLSVYKILQKFST